MDIPKVSMALANVQLSNQVGVAMLDKTLENTEEMGASFVEMMDRSMELSVNPYIGGNIDMLV